jgi:dTDP-4-amino-4,6-dideoxygalactose transaminase
MIPLLDTRAQYEGIRAELEPAVLEVLASGGYVSGKRVAAFEERFAAYCGAREAVAVNTGTSALHLALLALDIGPGDEVVTVAMTFVATIAAIKYAGATPVLVDVDPETFCLDPARLEAAITPRTRAIMPVHLHGRLADMAAIGAIAARHNIPVIEDAAQAHGAAAFGRRAGTFGVIGCFSFYPGKNLGACGEGGGIVTDDPALAQTMRELRSWGEQGRYNHVRHGFNYRMDELQAAALEVKLRHVEAWTAGRRRVAAAYDARFAGGALRTPPPGGAAHVYHVYAVRHPERDRLRAGLQAAGIATGLHYPKPVHLQPAYADLGRGPGSFPVAELLAEQMLSLPIYPEMTDAQVARVADTLLGLADAAPEQVRAA